jgi:nitrogen fixation protein NifU and related proteins
MQQLYQKNILDHGINPRNRGLLMPADIDYEADNASCGDRVRLTLRLDQHNRIMAVGWGGEGCAISQAAASMLGEVIVGKKVDYVKQISKDDLFAMLGVPLSVSRERCALLPLKALTVALYGAGAWRKYEMEEEG